MLVDTDILIWYMRGNIRAKEALDELGSFSISAVVYMEIVQGIRDKKELKELKLFMKNRVVKCIPLDTEITSRAIFFMEKYSLSDGLRLADALIASTVDILGETLFTANISHYRKILRLQLKKFPSA
ncbi:MAG: type II toxin-antitoxin system VapC family toxin [bacterium]